MTRPPRGPAWLAAAVGILCTCNGALRFDETPLDARGDGRTDVLTDSAAPPDGATDALADAPDGAADAPVDAASCIDAGNAPCGWSLADCEPNDDNTCERYCRPGLTCTNGACGIGCAADCLENSTCAIATGDVSRVECKAGASCTATLGGGSNAACAAGSSCRIQCAGRCDISCQAGATCQLRCGAAADFTTVTGTASCP